MKRLICWVIVIFLLPIQAFAEPQGMNIGAKSAVLIEASTGKVLFEQNSHEKLPIASVTKVMTMLLIMEALDGGKIKKEDMVTVSEYATSMGGSQVYLEPNEQMSVHEMLKAIAVGSANDACVAMAEHLTGSETAFVKAMNDRAKELGMVDTTFINTNGLDEDGHLSTAHDVALMSRELLFKHPTITEYTTIWLDSLRNGAFGLSNTNKLVRFYKGSTGLKTGSTGKALYCVSASALRDNMSLISVILGSPTSKDRFAEASKLLDYGFANYAVASGVKKGDIVKEVKLTKGVQKILKITVEKPLSLLIDKGKQDKIQQKLDLPTEIQAPVTKGQKVGEATYTLDGKEIGKVDLVAAEVVERYNVLNVITTILKSWMSISI